MDIIEKGLSYFDNGAVPEVKQFADEVWRPNRKDMTPIELKLTDFMADYVYCYQYIKKLRFDASMFQTRYALLLKRKAELNPLLAKPLDVDGLSDLLADAKIELQQKNDKRVDDRFAVVKQKVLPVKDKIAALNVRREHLLALMSELQADIKTVSDEIDDDEIEIDVKNIFLFDGGFVIADKKPSPSWEYPQYSYDVTTGDLTKIKNTDCDPDCYCDYCD